MAKCWKCSHQEVEETEPGKSQVCDLCRRNMEEDFKKALAARKRQEVREEATR